MAYALVFDGVNDNISFTPVDLTSGDTLTLNYIAPVSMPLKAYLFDNDGSGVRPYMLVYNQQGVIQFNTSVMAATLDGTAIVNLTTPYPADGLEHTIVLTITSNCRFGSFGRRYTNGEYANLKLIYLAINTSLKWDATASSHAAGSVTLLDTLGTNDATGANFPTDGSAWVNLGGGGGITLTATEVGPSFTEVINSGLGVNLSSNITEQGPGFTDVVSVNLSTLTIQANISESGPSFNDTVNVNLTASVGINLVVAESGPSFTDSISASLDVNITTAITELGPSFTDSISLTIQKDTQAIITSYGPVFSETINASIPITITVNPRNIVRVKRNSNAVIIKRKTNIIRVR